MHSKGNESVLTYCKQFLLPIWQSKIRVNKTGSYNSNIGSFSIFIIWVPMFNNNNVPPSTGQRFALHLKSIHPEIIVFKVFWICPIWLSRFSLGRLWNNSGGRQILFNVGKSLFINFILNVMGSETNWPESKCIPPWYYYSHNICHNMPFFYEGYIVLSDKYCQNVFIVKCH